MSMKVYIHFEEAGKPEKTTKISVPHSWSTGKNVSDVIALFAKSYNSQNPEHEITVENVHLANGDGQKIFSNVICGTVLEDRMDYYIKAGVHLESRGAAKAVEDETRLKCKNYGCNKYYSEEENGDTACLHHSGPPVFHDTAKYWSCCGDTKKAYDFETFQQIVGCTNGRHSTVNRGATISASPNSVSDAPPPPPLKSIADFNTANPAAATAEAAAVKITTAARKSSRSVDGLSAKCQRKGCQKPFTVAENTETACRYHKGQPIFHDAVKFWSCCPEKKCYDFEEFMVVPGCAVGVHDDGVIDLSEAGKAGGAEPGDA